MKKLTKSKTGTENKVIEGEISGEPPVYKKQKIKALAKIEGKGIVLTADNLISQAIKGKVSVEIIERIMALRDKQKAEWAKEQFDKAMAAFQSECPIIKKTKTIKTKAGEEAYSYAPLESILIQVKPLLENHGFSYSIQTETGEKKVKATCLAKHKDGHSEPSSMEVPLGNKTQIMSDTQVTAAALTFAKRYAFCNVFGILTGDDDNEAVLPKDKMAKDSTNYLDKLKVALRGKGAKTTVEAIDIFNNITGYSIKEFPTESNDQVKEMYEAFIGSPKAIE